MSEVRSGSVAGPFAGIPELSATPWWGRQRSVAVERPDLEQDVEPDQRPDQAAHNRARQQREQQTDQRGIEDQLPAAPGTGEEPGQRRQIEADSYEGAEGGERESRGVARSAERHHQRPDAERGEQQRQAEDRQDDGDPR